MFLGPTRLKKQPTKKAVRGEEEGCCGRGEGNGSEDSTRERAEGKKGKLKRSRPGATKGKDMRRQTYRKVKKGRGEERWRRGRTGDLVFGGDRAAKIRKIGEIP